MKNPMFKAIAALACAVVLAACGGGSTTTTTPLPPQPNFDITEDIKPTNPTPTVAAGDLVTFSYTGWLYDETKPEKKGDQFESSTDTVTKVDKPFAMTVGVGARIAGWDKALIGMMAGGRRVVTIPASMAFGTADYKDSTGKVLVPANTAVIYELKVITFTTLPSPLGLTKIDTVSGTGVSAATNHLVTIHYTGYLYDDTKSDKKGAQFETSGTSPFSFLLNVNSRIPGWDQGIIGMQVGGKRTLIIPASMAWDQFGRKDSSGNYLVPPNSNVVYDIELTALNTSPPTSTSQPAFSAPDDLIGSGTVAVNGSKLTVQYSGYLYNDNVTDKKGTRFDTSRTTGVPFGFTLGTSDVIDGWNQGIVGMKVGGRRTLIIPASLAYRDTAKPGIPANSALVFEVELISVTP